MRTKAYKNGAKLVKSQLIEIEGIETRIRTYEIVCQLPLGCGQPFLINGSPTNRHYCYSCHEKIWTDRQLKFRKDRKDWAIAHGKFSMVY